MRNALTGEVQPQFSIVIPARNESACIGACLESIEEAARNVSGKIEIIVVLNRCTDDTGAIAEAHGAQVVCDDSRNLAKIRNAGERHATGEILATIDADSTMSPNMLAEIYGALRSGRYIGGGVPIHPERWSLGIIITALMIYAMVPPGLSAGLFWCYRRDFEALGGFNEDLVIAEDIDFAKRLKACGRKMHRRFGTLWKTHVTTSCRKFDRFGDWALVWRPIALWRGIHGVDTNVADRLFYDFER